MTLVRPRHELDWPKVTPERSKLAIDVLGGLALSVDGARVSLGNKKGRALLAYLALEKRRALPRDAAAMLFWSESTEHHADTSLRQSLLDIRRALLPHELNPLPPGQSDLALDHARIELDLDRAFTAIALGRVPAGLMAVDQMLAGCEGISRAFDQWLQTQRQNARGAVIRALERASEDTALPPAQRRRLAKAALELDDINEAACRTVMRLAAEAGESGAAIRAYDALYAALGTQLDMEPSEPTRALVAAIKLEQVGARSAPAPRRAAAATDGPPIVAILPLRHAGHATEATVAECIQEGVVRVLAGFREPAVISWNSSRAISADENSTEAARRLGAGYLVGGSLHQSGGNHRVAIELVDLGSGGTLATPVFDAEAMHLFDIQDRIAAAIGHTLAPHINASEVRRSRTQRTEDLGDYHLMLRARALMNQLEPVSFAEAGTLLQAAAARSGFGSLFATLADWHSLRIFQGLSPDRGADTGAMFAALRQALTLDPGHARAKAQLGHNLTMTAARHDEALGLFAEALADAPSDAEVQGWSTPTLVYSGQAAEAVRRAEWAMRLSPRDPFLFRYQSMRALAHYAAGDLEEAAHWARVSEATNPRYLVTLRLLAAACIGLGRTGEARDAVGRHAVLEPGLRVSRIGLDRYCRDQTLRKRWTQDLIAAGLPE